MTTTIEYMTVGYYRKEWEEIYYCDTSEIGAFKRYNQLKIKDKNIFKVKVRKDFIKDILFIIDYEVLEIIK